MAARACGKLLPDDLAGGVHDLQRRRLGSLLDPDPEPAAVGHPRMHKIEKRPIVVNDQIVVPR